MTASTARTSEELIKDRPGVRVSGRLLWHWRFMPKIFICYRRTDTAGYAGRVYDGLVHAFGQHSVFMDVDTLKPGIDFVEALENVLNSCDVVVALIGTRWPAITRWRRLRTPRA